MILRWMHPPSVKRADDDPEEIEVVKKFDRCALPAQLPASNER